MQNIGRMYVLQPTEDLIQKILCQEKRLLSRIRLNKLTKQNKKWDNYQILSPSHERWNSKTPLLPSISIYSISAIGLGCEKKHWADLVKVKVKVKTRKGASKREISPKAS